jgi:molybdate transport system substrate-binding protein
MPLWNPVSRILAITIALGNFSGCGSNAPEASEDTTPRELSVAAASDLKFALDEIVQEFGKLNQGIRVSVSYGSSGNYYSLLSNQAPFDVFLSADLDFPRKLAQQGLTLADSEFVYAVGRIAVWVPASSPIDVEKLQMSALKHSSVAHIAIANPQHAPYGRAAEEAMRSTGIYNAVQPKLVVGENIAQTLQFIQSGNAEIGIVALSLAVAPTVRGQGRFWEIPLDRYPRMDQGGVILKWAKDPDAAETFRGFLIAPAGRSILRKFGFELPEE